MHISRLVLAISLLWLAPAWAVELKNDSYDGGNASFIAAFGSGEAAGVRFISPFPATQLNHVSILYGGAAGTRFVRLKVWDDSAMTPSPGSELLSSRVQLTASNTSLQTLDASVQVPSTFRVGIEFEDGALPSVARDNDGIDGTRNFALVAGMGWMSASTLGLAGDFIIRADVSAVDAGSVADGGPDAGAIPDAGVDGGSDAGVPDAGATDAGAIDSGTTDGSVMDSGIPALDAGLGCLSNTECAVGTYCDTATRRCTFDCRTDVDCGERSTCSSLGKCVAATQQGCGCSSSDLSTIAGLLLLLFWVIRRQS